MRISEDARILALHNPEFARQLTICLAEVREDQRRMTELTNSAKYKAGRSAKLSGEEYDKSKPIEWRLGWNTN